MATNHHAALRLAALTLPGLLIAANALAQNIERKDDRTTGFGGQYDEPAAPQPPLGHRQPMASELPAHTTPTQEDEWLNRVNRETDRKLQICRGC